MSIGPTASRKEEIPPPQPGCPAGDPVSQAAPPARWRALALISMAELLGMSLWFSASAVLPRAAVGMESERVGGELVDDCGSTRLCLRRFA